MLSSVESKGYSRRAGISSALLGVFFLSGMTERGIKLMVSARGGLGFGNYLDMLVSTGSKMLFGGGGVLHRCFGLLSICRFKLMVHYCVRPLFVILNHGMSP